MMPYSFSPTTDPVITPEMFAQSVVDDYSLPQSSVSTITKAIQEQLSDFKAHTIESIDDDGFFGTAPARSADDDIWWERWRNGLRTESGAVRRKKRKSGSGPGPSDPTTSYIKFESGGRPAADQNQDDDSMEEMRILIKVSDPGPRARRSVLSLDLRFVIRMRF